MVGWHEENGRPLLEPAIKLAADVVETEGRNSITSEFIWAPPVASLVELSDNAEMVVVGNRAWSVSPRVARLGQFWRGATGELPRRGDSRAGSFPAQAPCPDKLPS